MPIDVGAELAEEEHGKRGRTDAVDVVIAMHADACSTLHSRSDPFYGGRHVAEKKGIVPGKIGIQETPRVARIVVAAADEHGRCDVADAELSRERSRCVDVEGGDRPGARHSKDGTGATGQS